MQGSLRRFLAVPKGEEYYYDFLLAVMFRLLHNVYQRKRVGWRVGKKHSAHGYALPDNGLRMALVYSGRDGGLIQLGSSTWSNIIFGCNLSESSIIYSLYLVEGYTSRQLLSLDAARVALSTPPGFIHFARICVT